MEHVQDSSTTTVLD